MKISQLSIPELTHKRLWRFAGIFCNFSVHLLHTWRAAQVQCEPNASMLPSSLSRCLVECGPWTGTKCEMKLVCVVLCVT
ncbi:hypothetical protein GDO81_015911 [Engystomops pustulosus]|uniref:Uncharacterized protein n=1 Tax=Engystomops pustulosus TaxID=76066 RepID=A0AAV7AP15_ENGPU|nr:hypothetical protein GDO81_015911 [Engystomops pustulosus]